jgi:hypothetical protein
MDPSIIILLVALIFVIALMVWLYKWGKKTIKQQEETRAEMNQSKQYVSMLIIDKKQLRLKNSGLPQTVIDQAPWYQRNNYVSVVKAKVGPQIMVLLCDREIFDMIPVKKEVKAAVSGIYILEVKALHGKLPKVEVPKKKGFKKFMDKLQEKAGAKPL